MSINSIGSGASFASSGAGLDAEGQFALLVLEQEQTHADAAHDDKALGRERFLEASHKEVEAMHDEADSIMVGAFVSAGIGVASSACQFASIDARPDPLAGDATHAQKLAYNGASKTADRWAASGAALDKIGQPISKYVGESGAAHDRAHAKQASTAAEQARWSIEDASDAIQKSEKRQDKTLDWLAAETANKASTETGIIAGFA